MKSIAAAPSKIEEAKRTSELNLSLWNCIPSLGQIDDPNQDVFWDKQAVQESSEQPLWS